MTILGFIFILLGLTIFYFPNLIVKIFDYLRKNIFNEKFIFLHSKKISIVFLISGIVLIFSTFEVNFTSNKLYYAYKKYYFSDFKTAEKLCLELLSKRPKDTNVLELLGKIYFMQKRYELAKNIFLRVQNLEPKKEKIVKKYVSLIELKIKK